MMLPMTFLGRVILAVALLACAAGARGQVCAVLVYHAPGAGVPIVIPPTDGRCEVALHVPSETDAAAVARAEPGLIDAEALFPDLLDFLHEPIAALQLRIDGVEVGPALILEPLRALPEARDAWSARAMRALNANDRESLDALLKMPPHARAALRAEFELDPALEAASFAIRTYEDRRILLRTSAGDVALALRSDAAPRTAFHVRSLCEGGFFAASPIARLADTSGRPFALQLGDPAGDGHGGCGWTFPFELSTLEAEWGSVALSRRSLDPNSASSAIVIWLSEADADAWGARFAAFASVVEGRSVVRTLGSGRVGSPRVLDAFLIPAPPWSEARAALRPVEESRSPTGEPR